MNEVWGAQPVSGVSLRVPPKRSLAKRWESGRSFPVERFERYHVFGGGLTPRRGTEYAPQSLRARPACAFLDGLADAEAWDIRDANFTRAFTVVPQAPVVRFLGWTLFGFIGFHNLQRGTEFSRFPVFVGGGECDSKALRHGKPGRPRFCASP